LSDDGRTFMTVRKRSRVLAGAINSHAASGVTALDVDEAGLIERARRGERAAFGALYDRYVDAIYRYVAFRVRDDAEAEDVTSEVFVKAMVALPRYEPRTAFLAWLYRIARNEVIDRSRRASRHAEVPLGEPFAAVLPAVDESGDPERRAAANERVRRLRGGLSRLARDQQDVLVLRFIGGLSADEISLVLKKPASTVRGIQMRGLRALRTHLSPDDLG
jgi:RNA polymerase sigma-70 factor, ECF subfamily